LFLYLGIERLEVVLHLFKPMVVAGVLFVFRDKRGLVLAGLLQGVLEFKG
jgi:hypothetical protein